MHAQADHHVQGVHAGHQEIEVEEQLGMPGRWARPTRKASPPNGISPCSYLW